VTDNDQQQWEPQPTLLRGDTLTLDPRLDRLVDFDPRSTGYPVRAALADLTGEAKPPFRSHSWQCRTWLDQGREGACVWFSNGHRVASDPVRAEITDAQCRQYYREAQRIDPWEETPPEEGTSVLAGVKIGVEHGYYESYWWSFGIDDTLRGIGWVAPGVLGIYWLESMFSPRPSGLLEVSGRIAGGHAILARGVRMKAHLPGEGSTPIEVVRLRNSWGQGWGVNGDAFIRVEDLERLLRMEGECCFPVEAGQKRGEL
jgi:hypothetical protein